MNHQIGYLDIGAAEIERYREDVAKKVGICRIMPRGRFSIRSNGTVDYDGLICSSADMGGQATGMSASRCTNCVRATA